MVISNAHSISNSQSKDELQKDQIKPIIKTSGTGQAESPAKKAPLKAEDSVLLGGVQTSDGYKAKREKETRRAEQRDSDHGNGTGVDNETKLQNASLKPHLDDSTSDKPSLDKQH